MLNKLLLSTVFIALCATQTIFAFECPSTPGGTVIPHASLNPPPLPGEPLMTIVGLKSFITAKNIKSVSELLRALPDRYQKNYSLVEQTRTPGKSSLTYPRIILFGSDARLMFNVATDQSDPDYEKLDVAYLDPKTGEWEFSQFDFTNRTAAIKNKPAECLTCHGKPARPLWGTYLNWPGVIGDDPRPGDQAETLTPQHAQRFTELKSGLGNPERFHTLKWARSYVANQSQQLPDNAYGHALTISNNEIGYAMAESVWLRMKSRFPARYNALREEFILLGTSYQSQYLTQAERNQIGKLIQLAGGSGNTIHDLFKVLGINLNNDLSLSKLANESPNINWNAGSGDILPLVLELVLYDLAQADPSVKGVLVSVPNSGGVYGVWECPGLGQNVWEVLQHRVFHGWKIKGEARQKEHAFYYPFDGTRTGQPFFERPGRNLYNVLHTKIATTIQ